MDTGLLHTHHLVVVLYVLLLAAKVAVVWTKNKNLLFTLNGKTKILRIVLEALMLLTGGALLVKSPVGLELFSIVKYVVLVLAIGAGIIGVKRMNPILATFSLLCFAYIYGIAKTNSPILQSEESQVQAAVSAFPAVANSPADALKRGQAIYTITCLQCHGVDGTAAFRKAKNLATSPLSDAAKASIIKTGVNTMPAFTYLKEGEVQDLVLYINTFKK